MNFSGEATLHASQQEVWRALLDPQALARCLPGCQRLEQTAPDTFQAVVTLGIAAVKGAYTGTVRISDRDEPNRYTLSLEGAGATGTVKASGAIVLSPAPDGTAVHWSAEAQIGGPIASVGQRLIGGVAKLIANDFFKCMDAHLAQSRSAQTPVS